MAEYLACFETELSSEVFELFVLYSQENYVFKRKLCIHCMWIFHSRFIPFEIDLSTLVWDLLKLNNFCHVLRQLTLTAWTDLPASWCYASCFQVLICGFLNIIVWEIISLSVVCSFIVNKIAQNTMWGWDYSIQIELFYMWCFSHYIHHVSAKMSAHSIELLLLGSVFGHISIRS